jgi:hypothetical protein
MSCQKMHCGILLLLGAASVCGLVPTSFGQIGTAPGVLWNPASPVFPKRLQSR